MKKRILIRIGILFVLFGFNRLELFNPLSSVSFSQEVFAQNGQLLRMTLANDDQYRAFRKISEINLQTQQAVLLAEDQYFYYHWGINPVALTRAVLTLHDSRPVGASTITMQMVRLRDKLYTKNFSGKISQIFYAIGAEFLYSKKQILEAYLNLTPYGANVEGLGAASYIYFNKDVKNISVSEALVLAVIPQNPLKRNLEKSDTKVVLDARDRLFDRWKMTYPTESNFKTDIQIPLLQKRISELPFKAPHFVNFALGEDSKSLQIKTTLDLKLQTILEKSITSYLQVAGKKGVRNAAAILIDSKRNEIKAYVGSADFFNSEIQGQNDGILARRSPGSTLKPFLYGLAMDEGLIHPQSLLFDTASSFGSYDPENYDRTYKGPITAEEALIQSRNVPAIYLASRLKQKSLYQLMNEANIQFPQKEKFYGLAIALGSAEVSGFDLGSLYTALAHHGDWSPLRWRSDLKKTMTAKKLLSDESTFMILDMLKKNPRSESDMIDQISKEKLSIAWKTGTSYGFRDAWSVGLIGDHVLLVWLGNFDNSGNPALIGRELASPLFFKISDNLKSRNLIHDGSWDEAFGLKIKSVDVCSLTGQFANSSCPHLKKTWFNPGVSSIEDCHVHRAILISNQSGRRLCQLGGNSNFHKEVFEFWPSDIVQLFQKFGIPYKKTPAYEVNCQGFGYDDGLAGVPEIVSPKSDVKYAVHFDQITGYDRIPLKAKVDQDVKKIYWFANKKSLGQSDPNETFLVELIPGRYDITVVDDHGQTFSKPVVIETL